MSATGDRNEGSALDSMHSLLVDFKRLVKRGLLDLKYFGFEPYLKPLELAGGRGRFFFGTPQARDWYDPLRPHSRLEYEWVLANIPLRGQTIVDGGAHHGHYSVVLAVGAGGDCQLTSVDPHPMNCFLTEVNLRLNGFPSRVVECALSARDGRVRFSFDSNGRILARGGRWVASKRLTSIVPEADVVKLDIEGAEFQVVPDALDEMRRAHTWLVEVHPARDRSPEALVRMFLERDFKVLWLNRVKNAVEEYRMGAEWRSRTTIFALK